VAEEHGPQVWRLGGGGTREALAGGALEVLGSWPAADKGGGMLRPLAGGGERKQRGVLAGCGKRRRRGRAAGRRRGKEPTRGPSRPREWRGRGRALAGGARSWLAAGKGGVARSWPAARKEATR
jgi:hypothetical protein